jgi:TorA maturation chaperone TorD
MQTCSVQVFNLLADLFSQPDAMQSERIRVQANTLRNEHIEYADSLDALGRNAADFTADDLQQHIAEYNRLFVLGQVSVPAPLFASYWLESDHLLLGKSIRPVEELLAAHEIVVDPSSGLTPDHLVTELEFAAFLCEQDASADLHTLIAIHMQSWIPLFCAALRAAQPSNFYLLSADLLERAVARVTTRQAIQPNDRQASFQPLAGESHGSVQGT